MFDDGDVPRDLAALAVPLAGILAETGPDFYHEHGLPQSLRH
jgi:hypothetical protein